MRRERLGNWPEFSNGIKYPKLCWGSLFLRALQETNPAPAEPSPEYVVIALGAHEADRAYFAFPEKSREEVGKMIGSMMGSSLVICGESEPLVKAYQALVSSAGIGEIDIVILSAEGSEKMQTLAHYGPHQPEELAYDLSNLAQRWS